MPRVTGKPPRENGKGGTAGKPPAQSVNVRSILSLPDAGANGKLKSMNGTPKNFRELMQKIRQPHRNDDDDYPCLPALQEAILSPENVKPRFPTNVFPSVIRQYIEASARSIHCPVDLLAVPLLAVAGAAIGRAGRRLKVKDGWIVSSCLWTAGLASSSQGKSPAMAAVECFYDNRQRVEYSQWEEAKEAYETDQTNNPKPGPFPALKLSDTTIESLRADLQAGPVLFSRDELGGWCHQMGQYKSGNADRFDWNSFWSHSPVNIGRKSERVYVEEPFVSVTGMMVPASARELNYRGQADDGFVHRILLACPDPMAPIATLVGVPDELKQEYDRRMSLLFDPPDDDRKILTFEPAALKMILRWVNDEHYAELLPISSSPDWLISKYRKLYENCLRLCIVLHEIWRVAGQDHRNEQPWEPSPREFYGEQIKFNPQIVDRITVERAISVVNYFKGHIRAVQSLLGESEVDDVDRLYNRLRTKGTVTVREVIHKSTYKKSEQVSTIFTEWERRGYGNIEHPRKNQMVFRFLEK